MRLAVVLFAVLLALLALGGCGGDSTEDEATADKATQDKALSSVCSARADIGKQVQELAGLTPETLTTQKVSESLDAITGDLAKIKGARADLSDERRAEVESANKAFAESVKTTGTKVATSLTSDDLGAALTPALEELEASYKKTFAQIDCG